MKKAIIKSKNEYNRGSYTITNAGKWNSIIFDFQLSGVVADLKADGYKVYVNGLLIK